MDTHLGYEPYERTSNSNARNGRKPKSIRSKYGEMNIQAPQDRYQSRLKIFMASMLVKVWFRMLRTSFFLKLRTGSIARYPQSIRLYSSMRFTFLLETIT